MDPFRLIGKAKVEGAFSETCRGEVQTTYKDMTYFGCRRPELMAELLAPFPQANVSWVEIAEGAKVQPHVDHGIRTVLNLYVTTGGAVTTFWKPKPDRQPFCHPGKLTANRYLWSDILFTCYFKAQAGEAYLMDVTSVHSVTSMTGMGVRTILQAAWDLPFIELLKCISGC